MTDISKCHDMGVWSMDYDILRVQKHIAYSAAYSRPLLVRDRPLGLPEFVTPA